jgi:hypothetical protein
MKRTVLKFGLMAGAVASVLMLANVPFMNAGELDKGEILGYTSIVLSMLFVFFGVRSYREHAGGGRLTFLRGLGVGLLIMLVSCTCYVVTWEIVSNVFVPGLGDKVFACWIAKAQAKGASEAELAQMAKYKELYKNFFMNVAMTFMEPLPIGLAASVLSAAILRKRVPAA